MQVITYTVPERLIEDISKWLEPDKAYQVCLDCLGGPNKRIRVCLTEISPDSWCDCKEGWGVVSVVLDAEMGEDVKERLLTEKVRELLMKGNENIIYEDRN